jgi:hypothetical protein
MAIRVEKQVCHGVAGDQDAESSLVGPERAECDPHQRGKGKPVRGESRRRRPLSTPTHFLAFIQVLHPGVYINSFRHSFIISLTCILGVSIYLVVVVVSY